MLVYQSFFVLDDSGRTDFTNYNETNRFYCDNLPHNSYIELVGVCGIVGHTLRYNVNKENNRGKK